MLEPKHAAVACDEEAAASNRRSERASLARHAPDCEPSQDQRSPCPRLEERSRTDLELAAGDVDYAAVSDCERSAEEPPGPAQMEKRSRSHVGSKLREGVNRFLRSHRVGVSG